MCVLVLSITPVIYVSLTRWRARGQFVAGLVVFCITTNQNILNVFVLQFDGYFALKANLRRNQVAKYVCVCLCVCVCVCV